MNNNMENIISKNKPLVYLLVVFLASFIGSGIFLSMNSKKNDKQATPTPTIEQKNTKGSVNLKNNLSPNNINNPLLLSLIVDSDNENITGLDLVVSYDPISFDFVKADPVDPNFKFYSYKRDKRITLTIINVNQNSNSAIFKEKKIGSLTFQPKVKGNYTFEILPVFGKETTKFVNEQTKIFYPSNNKINVIIN